MRIVTGKYRHRLINWPDDIKTRPTKDRVREAFYNSLGDFCVDQTVLDLFAGSGSLGLEALSREAAFCYFVDSSNLACKCIKENIKNLKISNATVLCMDYKKALDLLKNKKVKIGLVLLDPPYALLVYKPIIDYLFANDMLKEDAIIVLESDHNLALDDARFQKIKEYKYGITYITVLRR